MTSKNQIWAHPLVFHQNSRFTVKQQKLTLNRYFIDTPTSFLVCIECVLSPSTKKSVLPNGCASCNCFLRILMWFILYSFIYIHRYTDKNFLTLLLSPLYHSEISTNLYAHFNRWANIYPTILFALCTNNRKWKRKKHRRERERLEKKRPNSISSVIFFNQKLMIFQKNDVNALQKEYYHFNMPFHVIARIKIFNVNAIKESFRTTRYAKCVYVCAVDINGVKWKWASESVHKVKCSFYFINSIASRYMVIKSIKNWNALIKY